MSSTSAKSTLLRHDVPHDMWRADYTGPMYPSRLYNPNKDNDGLLLEPEDAGVDKLIIMLAKDVGWHETHLPLRPPVDLDEWYREKTNGPAVAHLVKVILAFFAFGDALVVDNIDERLMVEINHDDVCRFYRGQIYQEETHRRAYRKQLELYKLNASKRADLRKLIFETEAISRKRDWIAKWTQDKTRGIIPTMYAYAILEGILFQSTFVIIYALRDSGHVRDEVAKYNEWIARDEGLHYAFGIHLIKKFLTAAERLPPDMVHDMLREAVAVEEAFLEFAIPAPVSVSVSFDRLLSYVKYLCNQFCQMTGYPILYKDNMTNPYKNLMSGLDMVSYANVFETTETEYAGKTTSDVTRDTRSILADEF